LHGSNDVNRCASLAFVELSAQGVLMPEKDEAFDKV
jgi:hypothetical protein